MVGLGRLLGCPAPGTGSAARARPGRSRPGSRRRRRRAGPARRRARSRSALAARLDCSRCRPLERLAREQRSPRGGDRAGGSPGQQERAGEERRGRRRSRLPCRRARSRARRSSALTEVAALVCRASAAGRGRRRTVPVRNGRTSTRSLRRDHQARRRRRARAAARTRAPPISASSASPIQPPTYPPFQPAQSTAARKRPNATSAEPDQLGMLVPPGSSSSSRASPSSRARAREA